MICVEMKICKNRQRGLPARPQDPETVMGLKGRRTSCPTQG